MFTAKCSAQTFRRSFLYAISVFFLTDSTFIRSTCALKLFPVITAKYDNILHDFTVHFPTDLDQHMKFIH